MFEILNFIVKEKNKFFFIYFFADFLFKFYGNILFKVRNE